MAKRKKKEWEHLRGVYPQAAISEDPKQIEFVSAERRLLKGRDPVDLMNEWNTLEDEKEALEQQIDALNVKITAREREVFDYMEAKGLEDLTVGNGYFSRHSDVTPKQDKRAVLEWALREMPDIVSVNYQTLTTQVKDALRKGTPLPDGVEVELRDRIKRTAA
jgi:hypothetical protein